MRGLRLYLLVLSLLALLNVACAPKQMRYKPGEYEGEGQGHHGVIKVRVITDAYKIMAINILEQQETPVLSDVVYERLPKKIIAKNTTEVDVVAGATFTSEGLLEAVVNGLEKARLNKDSSLSPSTDE